MKFCKVKVARSAVPSVLKQLSQLSEKAVTAIIRQLLLGAEVDKVNWMMLGCWREYLAFI